VFGRLVVGAVERLVEELLLALGGEAPVQREALATDLAVSLQVVGVSEPVADPLEVLVAGTPASGGSSTSLIPGVSVRPILKIRLTVSSGRQQRFTPGTQQEL